MTSQSARGRLDAIMTLHTVVRVHPNGAVAPVHDATLIYAPEFSLDVDEDGSLMPGWDGDLHRQAHTQGWSLMTGYSAEHGQGRSPLMAACQIIGGRMADDILATPGLYVAVPVSCDSETDAGWVVAYRHDE